MPTITLNRVKVQALIDFCTKNKLKQFFVAKDEGAYVGATMGEVNGKVDNCIYYFAGCDPVKNKDTWYDKCHDMFGGDDFGDMLVVSDLKDALYHPDNTVTAVKIKVTPRSISIISVF